MFGFGNLTDIRPDGTRAGDQYAALLGGRTAPRGGGLANILSTIGATLQDVDSGGATQSLARMQATRAAQAEKAQKDALMQGLLGKITGTGGQAGGGLPSIRSLGPDLLAAQAAGLDVGGLVSLLDKAGPQIDFVNGTAVDKGAVTPGQRIGVNGSNVNGTIVDMQDPRSIGMQVPELEKGMLRTVGPNGLPMAVPVAGYDDIVAGREGRIAGAKAQATAPFEFVNVPTASGAPGVMSKARAAGGSFVGQAPADAIRAQAQARGEADRASALQDRASTASRQLDALDTMETLLPDVIAGFGADFQLQAARALAATGNQDAQRKVTATETFLNQGRVLVSDIIKTFGANPTEGERKYAERMSGADAQLNPETLKEGIRLQRQRINRDLAAAGKAQGTPARATARPDRSAVEAELRRRGLIQ